MEIRLIWKLLSKEIKTNAKYVARLSSKMTRALTISSPYARVASMSQIIFNWLINAATLAEEKDGYQHKLAFVKGLPVASWEDIIIAISAK